MAILRKASSLHLQRIQPRRAEDDLQLARFPSQFCQRLLPRQAMSQGIAPDRRAIYRVEAHEGRAFLIEHACSDLAIDLRVERELRHAPERDEWRPQPTSVRVRVAGNVVVTPKSR